MDLELLRTFLEVERLRHFGNTAKELFVTPAAVSARIKQLEEHLGAQLFYRQSRQIELTPEGHRLKRYAERILGEWRKARHDVSIGKDMEQLSIGGTFRVWNAGLQEWLHDVHRTRQSIALIVESHTPEMLVRRLIDGQLDVGFMLEPPQLDALEIVEVAVLRLIMITDRADVPVAKAVEAGFITVDWGLGQATQQRRLYPDAHEPSLRMSQAHVAIAFIKAFGGAAYVANREVLDDVKESKLFPVKGAKPIDLMVYALFPVRSERRALIEEVVEQFEYRVTLPRRN